MSVTLVALVAETVRTDELPAVIDTGLAIIVTVGGTAGPRVTVAVAVTVPPGPIAVAVYVVVVVGLTDCVPPLAASV